MPLDLNAARALHDRDPNNPEACPTCTSDTDPHQMARWPCATAIALGATGRSEWDNTDAGHNNGYPGGDCQQSPNCTGPADHPGPCAPSWHPCGDYSTRSQGSLGPCVRDNGHNDGPHRDQNGGTW